MNLFSLRYFKVTNRHCCCMKIVPRNVKKRDGRHTRKSVCLIPDTDIKLDLAKAKTDLLSRCFHPDALKRFLLELCPRT